MTLVALAVAPGVAPAGAPAVPLAAAPAVAPVVSQQFEKLQMNTNVAHVINRSRSPSPHRSQERYMHETDDSNARYFLNAALNMLFCDHCSSQGHLVANCKLRQLRTFTL